MPFNFYIISGYIKSGNDTNSVQIRLLLKIQFR